jgi:choline-phosphate cytidylyltransferase
MKRVYIDGIFDLFHRGHLESLIQAKNVLDDVFLIVGVISDKDAEGYKRLPIINQDDRCAIIKSINIVNQIIEDAPLVITKDFIEKYNIDLVVHGFSNDDDWEKQKDFFDYLIKENKFKRISYYDKTSTTDIIKKIKEEY